ncbi:hypothetical protein ACFL6D_02905 [Spirochaetota bacterium]
MAQVIPVSNCVFKIVSYPKKSAQNINSIISFDIQKYFPINTDEYTFIYKSLKTVKNTVYVLIIGFPKTAKSSKLEVYSLIAECIRQEKVSASSQYIISIPGKDETVILAIDKGFRLLYATTTKGKNSAKDIHDIKAYIASFFPFKGTAVELNNNEAIGAAPPFYIPLLSQKGNLALKSMLTGLLMILSLFFLALSISLFIKNSSSEQILRNKRDFLASISQDLNLSEDTVNIIDYIYDAAINERKRNSFLYYISQHIPKDMKVKDISADMHKISVDIISLKKESIFTLKDKMTEELTDITLDFDSIFKNESGEYTVKITGVIAQ